MFAANGHARRVLIASLLVVIAFAGSMPVAAARNDTITDLSVAPVYYGAAGTAKFKLTLRRAARVTVTVTRPNGAFVRTVVKNVRLGAGVRKLRWDGRNFAGRDMRDGRYRVNVVAVNGRGSATARQRFRTGLPPIFPARPGAIVVTIDPGHGGPFLGAFYKRSYEKEFNLDIAFRLRALLQAAGVRVVLTRSADRLVNHAARDVNGDGKLSKADDLAARVDVANLARSDLHISIHNNSAGCRCVRGTEVFTSYRRSWTPEGHELATFVHQEQLRALSQFSSRSYRPLDRGVKKGSYYIMSPYNGHRIPRPSLMPTILTESLFVNNDVELALLRRPAVRQSLAVAFYLGIARYINTRDYGIAYELVREPTSPIRAGASARYVIRVTNRGNRRSSGWVLQLRAVRQVPLYDGSGSLGRLIGSRRIPDGLRPGQTVTLRVNVTTPPRGFWTIKAGVRINARERPYLSQHGVVELQTHLRTRRR